MRLQAPDRAGSGFPATGSPEPRTPLTSIAGHAGLLVDEGAGPLTPPQQRMLDAIGRNPLRLRQLIEDPLTLPEIETGAFRTVMRPGGLARTRPASDAQ